MGNATLSKYDDVREISRFPPRLNLRQRTREGYYGKEERSGTVLRKNVLRTYARTFAKIMAQGHGSGP